MPAWSRAGKTVRTLRQQALARMVGLKLPQTSYLFASPSGSTGSTSCARKCHLLNTCGLQCIHDRPPTVNGQPSQS